VNKHRELLTNTNLALLQQIVFTIFARFVPNQDLQIGILLIGFILSSIIVNKDTVTNFDEPKLSTIFLKWVIIAGTSYLSLVYAWVWFFQFNIDFFFLIPFSVISMALLVALPVIVSGGDKGGSEIGLTTAILGFFGWVMGVFIFMLSTNISNTVCLVVVFLIALISTIIFVPTGALWLIANLISGVVFAYLFPVATEVFPPLLPVIIASFSTALITGAAYTGTFERS